MSMVPAAGLTFGGGGGKPTCASAELAENPNATSKAGRATILIVASPAISAAETSGRQFRNPFTVDGGASTGPCGPRVALAELDDCELLP